MYIRDGSAAANPITASNASQAWTSDRWWWARIRNHSGGFPAREWFL